MAQLYLVGTNHIDIQGPERLRKFLDFTKPSLISLEADKDELELRIRDHIGFERQEFMMKLGFTMQYGGEKANNILNVLRVLGYESWVSNEYGLANPGVGFICNDNIDHEALKDLDAGPITADQKDGENQVGPAFIDSIAKLTHDEMLASIERAYQNASLGLFAESKHFDALFTSRDEYMEGRIRQAVDVTEGPVVALCGILHFFGDYHNLHDRLSDLDPVRISLNQVDKYMGAN
ncbi:hypothetical protein HOC96_00025 [archaeon]|jgi:hypothetical protein|nr:hypothetical protein [archaeon]